MLNEYSILQFLILSVLFLYTKLINLLTLWYAAGLYLILLGFYLLLNQGDIFVGFLWVVDLGVGLIFFIFILHFSNFLHQKSFTNNFSRFSISILNIIIISEILIFFLSSAPNFNLPFKYVKFYLVSWYDFYSVYNIFSCSTLQLLREVYFFNNSFEFFLINFVLLYGIFLSVILCFNLKKIFTNTTLHQFQSLKLLNHSTTSYFIRQQNFLRQQNTSTGTRVWKKKSDKHDL